MHSERIRILAFHEPWGNLLNSPACDCCSISRDRAQLDTADVVIFHIPQLGHFPPRKPDGQLWAAVCVESAMHYPILSRRKDLVGLFDLWMTYQRDADVWCPYFEPDRVADLRLEISGKTEPAPAAAFISSAYDRSGRIALLTQLMRHMRVDCYGKVRQNRILERDQGAVTKQRTIARYHFTLAFENAVDEDYVTEKFFDPLFAGSVPVYLGAPNIEDFAPGSNCLINAADYADPRELADHLNALAADANAYGRYLRWRSEPFRPCFLNMVERVRSPPLCRLSRLVRERRHRPARRS